MHTIDREKNFHVDEDFFEMEQNNRFMSWVRVDFNPLSSFECECGALVEGREKEKYKLTTVFFSLSRFSCRHGSMNSVRGALKAATKLSTP